MQAGRLLFRPCRTPNTQTLEFEPIKVPKGKCIVFCRDKQKKKNRYKPHFFMFTIRVLMLFLCYMYQMLCPCCLHFPLSSGILLPLQLQYIKMNEKKGKRARSFCWFDEKVKREGKQELKYK